MKRTLPILCGALFLLRAPRLFAQPSAAAVAAFNTCAARLESRLARQHRTPDAFLALDPAARARLRAGEILVENLTPTTQPTDALLHHWRASAFVPNTGVPGDPKGRWGGNTGVPGDPKGRWGGNATPAAFEHLLRDFAAYPQNFAPDVLSSTVLTATGVHGKRSVFAGVATPADTLLRLRTRQHHVLTVVLDTTSDVSFASLDAAHGYSISRSTRIDTIAPANTGGLLYRLNTYWSWEQRDDGLYLQLESLSLTRAIPRGLAWAVRPYLDSIPRDSLVFTLTSARNALRKSPPPRN